MGKVEDEVRKSIQYFVKSALSKNCERERDGAVAKGNKKVFGNFFLNICVYHVGKGV